MLKRGQVNNLGPIMIAMVLAGLLLVFGVIITQEIRDIDVLSDNIAATIVNESGFSINQTTYTCTRVALDQGFDNFVVTLVTNLTLGYIINADNYTVDSTAGTITGTSEDNFTDVYVTYTYTHDGQAYIAANDTVVGLGTFADFWEIIILAIVISIVIGLLLVVFGRRTSR